ncbi:DUF4190 domain-containing protein [Streptomyces sp. YS415]|uniref:DUF4190 domain-containing protein n=1 Tax=Streptomyces sp. YS415 TaxID=2944806 RepID=UPI00202166AD|nr:DUF4190 domain-containing protein [Streptomyces sp. YS415]MCL7426656.1 DUF4190 domain-containing protein [Streptomyces sp. YS415]
MPEDTPPRREPPHPSGHGPAPEVRLDKGPDASAPEPNPWAPPSVDGPGNTVASASGTWSAPSGPSVHDQQTVASMPGVDATGPQQPWPAPANPFAAPGAPYGQGEPVPPPPIAPDGPGQIPYGYPGGHGYPSGYGYPGGPGYPGGEYAWAGMQPMPVPSNGMGTAALVLGIISAAVFCLWPVAILLGILALIFGLIGRGKTRRGEATNGGQALAGLICGTAGIVLGLAMLAFVIATR